LVMPEIFMRQQDLPDTQSVVGKQSGILLHQVSLAYGCSGLQIGKLPGALTQAHGAHASPHGSRSDQDNLPRLGSQLGYLLDQAIELLHIWQVCLISQDACAELDHDAPGLLQ
jgi:hypothetical protein